MDESIIASLKSYVGVSDIDKAFDQDIVLHINAAFSTLYEIGIGKDKPFSIDMNSQETWNSLFVDYIECLSFIKEYTYLRVRLLFDPPTNSSVMESFKQVMHEVLYRLQIYLEDVFREEDNDE